MYNIFTILNQLFLVNAKVMPVLDTNLFLKETTTINSYSPKMYDSSSKNRQLTDEEKNLWQRVVHTLAPLWAPKVPPSQKKHTDSDISKKISPQSPQEGFEKHTERKFKQRTLKIEAALDLHGCSREQAYGKLASFLERSYAQNKRCLLIITGKGSGILREAILTWITQGPYKTYITAYKQAPQNLGGAGALIVLLRKKNAL